MRSFVLLLCMTALALLGCSGESLDAQTCDLEQCERFDESAGTGLP